MNPVLDFLTQALDAKLAELPDDRARIVFLAQQYGAWQMKRQRFFAQSQLQAPLPREFDMGPHGWITATDFVLVLGLIDRRRAEIEKRREIA